MWVPTIATVESDPVLHGRYQFWAFAYPTDDPLLISALKLRESLEQGLPSSHAPFPRISITVLQRLVALAGRNKESDELGPNKIRVRRLVAPGRISARPAKGGRVANGATLATS